MTDGGEAPYLNLDLPHRFELQFLQKGEWWGEARCLAHDFERLEDGSYAGSAGGSPIRLRCVERRDGGFIHIDGRGRRFIYRLLPLGPSE